MNGGTTSSMVQRDEVFLCIEKGKLFKKSIFVYIDKFHKSGNNFPLLEKYYIFYVKYYHFYKNSIKLVLR